jgi:hypothetical protein
METGFRFQNRKWKLVSVSKIRNTMLFGIASTSWKPVSVSKIGNGNWFPFPKSETKT